MQLRLDGIAVGIWDTLLPLMLARFVAGSGRYSASRGLLGIIQGVGGSLSNAAGGVVATMAGYSAAFGMLALFAGLTLCLVSLLPGDTSGRNSAEHCAMTAPPEALKRPRTDIRPIWRLAAIGR